MNKETLEDGFQLGGLLAIVLLFVFFFSALRNASSFNAAIALFERFTVTVVYAVVPTNQFALIVDAAVALVGGSLVADGFEFNIRIFIVTAGFLWVGTNLVINWLFPPV